MLMRRPARLAFVGALALTCMLFVGTATAWAATPQHTTRQIDAETALNAQQPNLPCPCIVYVWEVWSVSGAYDTQGPWWDCAPIVDNDGHNATWGCSDSYTVGNNVSGTLTVSTGTISASVGFSVTSSFTRGTNYSLAPGTDWYGEYEARDVYSTKTVVQREKEYNPLTGWTWLNNWATAYANEWIGFTYQPLSQGDD
jgi:hypothetical protein